MSKKITGILAYITWIGWIVAFLAGDREGAKFHLNQALVLMLTNVVLGVVAIIPIVGTIITLVGSVVTFVFWIMGLVAACKEEEKPLPLIGKIVIIK